MFEALSEHLDRITRMGQPVGCWVLGCSVMWRGYQVMHTMDGLYMLVLCILFGFSVIGLGIAMMESKAERQQQP